MTLKFTFSPDSKILPREKVALYCTWECYSTLHRAYWHVYAQQASYEWTGQGRERKMDWYQLKIIKNIVSCSMFEIYYGEAPLKLGIALEKENWGPLVLAQQCYYKISSDIIKGSSLLSDVSFIRHRRRVFILCLFPNRTRRWFLRPSPVFD